MKIAYKVVQRIKDSNYNGISAFAKGEFETKYNKGEILETQGTLGFFLFLDKEKAKRFILHYFDRNHIWNKDYKIIRVELLEKFLIPDIIASGITEETIRKFYMYNKEFFGGHNIPNGTIYCKKIKVLN
jgi:hypothetical protein